MSLLGSCPKAFEGMYRHFETRSGHKFIPYVTAIILYSKLHCRLNSASYAGGHGFNSRSRGGPSCLFYVNYSIKCCNGALA
jgi:hypothetical protein